MKTAISIPDSVFRRAERLAKQRKVSRSQLYTAALIHLLESQPKDEVTHAYNSAFADDKVDPFTSQAARAVLAGIEWSDE